MLIVFNRQRAYAISVMCGAREGQLLVELVIEIGLVGVSGMLLGVLAASAVVPAMSTDLYSISGTLPAFGMTMGVVLVISLIAAACCYSTIHRASPVNVLRNSNE